MGQIKAFRDGNYFILIDQISGNRFEEPAKNVKITGATQFPQKYRFFGFSGFDDLQRIDVADLLDANGEAYADEDTWVAYKNANTGNFNTGGATPQTPSDLISEDADNAIVLGDDDKLYAAAGGGSPFVPAEHNLTEFTNDNTDPFARVSDIPKIPDLPMLYEAILPQAGSAAPTGIVLQNNTGRTFSFARLQGGAYKIIPSVNFDLDKVAVIVLWQNAADEANACRLENVTINGASYSTFDASDTSTLIEQNGRVYVRILIKN